VISFAPDQLDSQQETPLIADVPTFSGTFYLNVNHGDSFTLPFIIKISIPYSTFYTFFQIPNIFQIINIKKY